MVDHSQRTLLHLAVIAGSIPCVRLLLSHDANTNIADSTSFLAACPPENDSLLCYSVLGTVSSFEQISSSYYRSNFYTYDIIPTFYAISGSRKSYKGVVKEVAAEMIRLLLTAGANMRAVDNNNETILHVTVRSKRYRVVEEILAFNDMQSDWKDMKDKWGKTAADIATESGDKRMKKIFMTTGKRIR